MTNTPAQKMSPPALPPIEIVKAFEHENGTMQVELVFPKAGGTSGRAVVNRQLLSDPRALQATLASRGAPNLPDIRDQCKRLLAARPPETVIVTDRGGWRGDALVTPYGTFGKVGDRDGIVFDVSSPFHKDRLPHGARVLYSDSLATPLKRSRYITFALCAALAAPLGSRIGRSQGSCFAFTQDSSVGKTLAIRVAHSAMGGHRERDLVSANATPTGAIDQRAAFGGTCICLGDLKASVTKERSLAHVLQTMAFAGSDYSPRVSAVAIKERPPDFGITLFSAEVPLKDLFEKHGVPFQLGDAVRAIDIPVPTKEEGGIFDLADPGKSIGLVERMEAAIKKRNGTLVSIWAFRLAQIQPEVLDKIVERIEDEFMSSLGRLPNHLHRIAKHFALIAAAGCIASRWRLLPASREQITDAAMTLFARAADRLKGNGPSDLVKATVQLLADVSRFPMVQRGRTADPEKCGSGFRRQSGGKVLLYVWSDTLRQPPTATVALDRIVLPALQRANAYFPGKKPTVPVKQQGLGRRRAYVFDFNALLALIGE